jgi:hypothetical protein
MNENSNLTLCCVCQLTSNPGGTLEIRQTGYTSPCISCRCEDDSMKKENEDAFNELFRSRRQDQMNAEEEQQRLRTAEADFRKLYTEHMKSVVEPTLESLRQLFGNNGIKSTVVQAIEGPDSIPYPCFKIGLYVQTVDTRRSTNPDPTDAPVQIELSCNPSKGKAQLFETRSTRSGRSRGPAGQFSLDELTSDFIEQRVLAIMKDS